MGCFHCPQPAALRRWLFHKQMVPTSSTASSGSRLLRTQTWLLRWPECRTKREQPYQYCWHQSQSIVNDLQSDIIDRCSLSHRVAKVCLSSMRRWVEMRMADWGVLRFSDWRTSWGHAKCRLLSCCWTACQRTGSVTHAGSLDITIYWQTIGFVSYLCRYEQLLKHTHTQKQVMCSNDKQNHSCICVLGGKIHSDFICHSSVTKKYTLCFVKTQINFCSTSDLTHWILRNLLRCATHESASCLQLQHSGR